MTFCLGMRLEEGLIGLADTRITSGSECITATKVSCFSKEDQYSLFIMTSGLRSVRDKVMTYFEEALEAESEPQDKIFKYVNLLAVQLRKVIDEDKKYLEDSGLHINLHILIGGQCFRDKRAHLFMIYPQGNWVEVGTNTPYAIIGETAYGKPILDRALAYQDHMRYALKVGCLAFEASRVSAADVDFPMDVVVYRNDRFQLIECRFDKSDLAHSSKWWNDRIRLAIKDLPADWVDQIYCIAFPDSVT